MPIIPVAMISGVTSSVDQTNMNGMNLPVEYWKASRRKV